MTTVSGSVWDESKSQLVIADKRNVMWVDLDSVRLCAWGEWQRQIVQVKQMEAETPVFCTALWDPSTVNLLSIVGLTNKSRHKCYEYLVQEMIDLVNSRRRSCSFSSFMRRTVYRSTDFTTSSISTEASPLVPTTINHTRHSDNS